MLASFLDWAQDHPHLATLLAFLGIAVWVVLCILTNGGLFIFTVGVAMLVLAYRFIYMLFSGDW